jgi:hypothetical protein
MHAQTDPAQTPAPQGAPDSAPVGLGGEAPAEARCNWYLQTYPAQTLPRRARLASAADDWPPDGAPVGLGGEALAGGRLRVRIDLLAPLAEAAADHRAVGAPRALVRPRPKPCGSL